MSPFVLSLLTALREQCAGSNDSCGAHDSRAFLILEDHQQQLRMSECWTQCPSVPEVFGIVNFCLIVKLSVAVFIMEVMIPTAG